MEKIRLKAYGKINLGLDVTGRRPDSYHEINMVMQTVRLYDIIELVKLPENEIRLETDKKDLPTDEENIVYRAIRLMKEEYDIRTGISGKITKRIPVAAGMGGGSADAAAALKAMNLLFDLNLTEGRLMELGLCLGADVPFCIMQGTALAEGIGEKLKRLPPPPPFVVLIAKPAVSISTKEVYTAFDSLEEVKHPEIDRIVKALQKKSEEEFLGSLENVLSLVTVEKHPEINDIRNRMVEGGAAVSLMTGSGPTVFGLFKDRVKAHKTRKRLAEIPGMEMAVVTEWLKR